MELLQAIEASSLTMAIKESGTAYTFFLAFHTIGLSFLVGISSAVALRILGAAPGLPLAPLTGFFPLMYIGLGINLFTGIGLASLYPTNYFVDPVFYIKLGAILAAAVNVRMLVAHVFGDLTGSREAVEDKKSRVLASTLLVFWLIAIFTGRVTAYTPDTKIETAAALTVFLALALLLGYVIGRGLGWIGGAGDEAEASG